MKASDVLMDFIIGICLPTVDVYTDIALMYRYVFIPHCKDVGFDILDSFQSHFDPTGEKEYIDIIQNKDDESDSLDPFLLLNLYNNFSKNDAIFNICNEMGTNAKFGLLMLCPIIISTIFIFGQWLRIEDSPKERLYTFPLLLLQLYPQYRTLKILYMALWKRDIRWKKDKEMLERNLKSIGRFSKMQK